MKYVLTSREKRVFYQKIVETLFFWNFSHLQKKNFQIRKNSHKSARKTVIRVSFNVECFPENNICGM